MLVDPPPDPDLVRLHAVTLGTEHGSTDDSPFCPHALLTRLLPDAPTFAQGVDETETSPNFCSFVDAAHHHFTVGVIDDGNAETVSEQVEIDGCERSGMAHAVAQELGNDDTRVVHQLTAIPRSQCLFDKVARVRRTLWNGGESDARMHHEGGFNPARACPLRGQRSFRPCRPRHRSSFLRPNPWLHLP